MRRSLLTIAALVAVLAIVTAAVVLCKVVGSPTLQPAEKAQIAAAAATGVAALAGVVTALAAAAAAGRSEETALQLREVGVHAAEAASLAMLPRSIDAQVRIELQWPRAVLFSVNTDEQGWKVVRATRQGVGGPEDTTPLNQLVQGAHGWVLPDDVISAADFDAWLTRVDLDIADDHGYAQWTVRSGEERRAARSGASDAPLGTLNAPVLFVGVTGKAIRRTVT